MSHKPKCRCEICENGMEAYRKKEAELVEKVGWYIHLVGDYPNGMINAHTHNLENHVNHPDLQIVLPIDDKSISNIFHNIIGKIKDGATFKDGDKANGVLKSMPVAFFAARDGDRDVLRVILPDTDGVIDRYKVNDRWLKPAACHSNGWRHWAG